MRIAVLAVVDQLRREGAPAGRLALIYNGILEGMAAGLPMLLTDVGGNAEAVVDGETGLVVPAHDPARLGASLASLAGDPVRRRAMGAAGRRRVAEHFSLDACVAAYERLYEGLLTALGRPVQALIDAG